MSTRDEKKTILQHWQQLVQVDKEELGDFPRFAVHPLVVTEEEKRNLFRMCMQSAADRDRISKISARYEAYKKAVNRRFAMARYYQEQWDQLDGSKALEDTIHCMYDTNGDVPSGLPSYACVLTRKDLVQSLVQFALGQEGVPGYPVRDDREGDVPGFLRAWVTTVYGAGTQEVNLHFIDASLKDD